MSIQMNEILLIYQKVHLFVTGSATKNRPNGQLANCADRSTLKTEKGCCRRTVSPLTQVLKCSLNL